MIRLPLSLRQRSCQRYLNKSPQVLRLLEAQVSCSTCARFPSQAASEPVALPMFTSKGILVCIVLLSLAHEARGSGSEDRFQVIFEGHPADGQIMKKTWAASEPSIAAPSMSATDTDMYTVLMTDPDAPSPSELSCKSWLHWIYVDASGSHLTGGKAISAYTPPTPPKGTHTYHVALYKQSKSLAGIEGPGSRCKFNPEAFAKENGLEFVAERTMRVAGPDE